MASTVRGDSGGSVIGLAIVFVSLVFRGLIPAPTWVWFVVLAVGVLLAVKDGISGLDVITLGLAGFMIVGPLISGAYTTTTDAPDLVEPIPVPSGYGFELDPDSTNLEHMYDSKPMPPQRAELAAVEVIDHYVNGLTPAWSVVDREERPENLQVTLREGDSSRGIAIGVYVFTPESGPAILDLRLQARFCREDVPGLAPGESACMTAPIRHIVRFPDGGPVSGRDSALPVREPVPVPPGYGFSPDAQLTDEHRHVYRSTLDMSAAEADQVQRAVTRYYRQALDDWIVLETGEGLLKVREADSRDGLVITVRNQQYATGWRTEIWIGSIYCPEEYWCL